MSSKSSGSSRPAACWLCGVILLLAMRCAPVFAQGAWTPDTNGAAMVAYTHNVNPPHTTATWLESAGFRLTTDATATYDTWSSGDHAPQVRFRTDATGLDIRNENFVITAVVELPPERGENFQAGLFMTLMATSYRFYWGPHGRDSLRFRREDGVDIIVPYHKGTVHLKLKHHVVSQHGSRYAAWYSEDGLFWTKAGEETMASRTYYAGAMLKTWGTPRAETAEFRHFDFTYVRNDSPLLANTPDAVHEFAEEVNPMFTYVLSGTEILLHRYMHVATNNAMSPNNIKLYKIHGSGTNQWGQFNTSAVYRRLTGDFTNTASYFASNACGRRNFILVVPRFLRGPHPYADIGRSGFWYVRLRGEEDRILMDIHEDYVRERWPASGLAEAFGADDRFWLMGHSGGAQFISRFLMAHAPKVFRAVVSSPGASIFPTDEYVWPFGLHIPDEYAFDNRRLRLHPEAVRDIPLAVIIGENDNLVNRGGLTDRSLLMPLAHARHDGARKWHRQMHQAYGGMPNLKTYFVPDQGHVFSPPKRELAMDFLFGTVAERAAHNHLAYTYRMNSEDISLPLAADELPQPLLEYFEFARFDLSRSRGHETDERLLFNFNTMACQVFDRNGTLTDILAFTYENDLTSFTLSFDEQHYTSARWHYGKLMLYEQDGPHRLEQTGIITPAFINAHVIDQTFHVFNFTGRDYYGPTAPWLPSLSFRVHGDGTVTDAETGLPPADASMRHWTYDQPFGQVIFHTIGGFSPRHMGEWRYGMDSEGTPYVAMLHTEDANNIRRTQMQTTPVFNPRYFEDWDLIHLDYDQDGIPDLLDNAPVHWNPAQTDTSGDGVGDACEGVFFNIPFFQLDVLHSAGGEPEINWNLADDPGMTGMVFRIYRAEEADEPGDEVFAPLSGWISDLSFLDTDAQPGKGYLYKIIVAHSNNTEDVSYRSASVSGWSAPGTPAAIWATKGTYPDFAAISWEAAAGAAAYQVWRSHGGKEAEPLSCWITGLQFLDTDALPGAEYEYSVRASGCAEGTRPGGFSETVIGHSAASGAMPYDFGDAPASFPVLLAQNGARHVVMPGIHLGPTIMATVDGNPTENADGDADDDGVFFPTPWVAGAPAVLEVHPSVNGYINVWADLDGNGTWSEDEHVIVDAFVHGGKRLLGFDLPRYTPAVTGVIVRVRFSTYPGAKQHGIALDGEVEDYRIPEIRVMNPFTFGLLNRGTAPYPYPVEWLDNGACHDDGIEGLWLGEGYGPDGIEWPSTLVRGQSAMATITAPEGGYLSGWIDFNSDYRWDESERIWEAIELTPGVHELPFTIPTDAIAGTVAARVRLVSQPVPITPLGYAPDGEVEDYLLTIHQTVSDTQEVHILDARLISDGWWPAVDLNWSGPSGLSYIVQRTTNLLEGAWEDVSGATSQQSLMVEEAGSTIYYRIKMPHAVRP